MRTDRYTFDNFSVDYSNEEAIKAVKLFAENFGRGTCPCPVVIYGKSWTGKTHLLRAAENLIRSNHPQKNILYITAQQFCDELICAIQKGEKRGFTQKYINLDVLIVDDVQYFSGKIQTSEEFSRLLDELYDKGAAILLSLDCEINNSRLTERICSRLSQGLMVEIGVSRPNPSNLQDNNKTGIKNMAKITSAEASKILKKLNEELNSVMRKEEQSKDFLAALGEDPETVRPKYDYADTSKKIAEIETKIRLLKHSINVFNTTTIVPEINMTIDQALIYIPQLSKKCNKLWEMMNKLPKTRENAAMYGRGNSIIDYRYINYDVDEVKRDYYWWKNELDVAQLQLDLVNSTFQLSVDASVIE